MGSGEKLAADFWIMGKKLAAVNFGDNGERRRRLAKPSTEGSFGILFGYGNSS